MGLLEAAPGDKQDSKDHEKLNTKPESTTPKHANRGRPETEFAGGLFGKDQALRRPLGRQPRRGPSDGGCPCCPLE
eukprot:2599143-Alexandrium_andersonii.AAC.1